MNKKPIQLVSDTINKDDIAALVEWLSQDEIPRLTKGTLTVKLEQKWAEKIGTKYSVFVNSGSSSILLSLAAFLYSNKARNKKVIVPALSWATDISSPMLLGMEPIMCDCNLIDLSCDLNHLEKLFAEHRPSSFILVSTLGLVPDMNRVVDLCRKYDVALFEDVCESMGSKYQDKYIGSFGVASFFSMYFGHHLSTIEGGFINTDDEDFYHLLLMMRSHGWDRDLPEWKQKELRGMYNCDEFSALYNFYVPGFNLRATDLQAFIGLRAIDKLDKYAQRRNENFNTYKKVITNNELLLEIADTNFVSNFAFPIITKDRDTLVKRLQDSSIDVRPLIAGNMASKPMWTLQYETVSLPNCELVNAYGLYLPNHQDLSKDDINKIANIVDNKIINKK
jgi:CDP-6-deoxy-D-xylo-4-hexulose-3-dehydrase